MNSIANIFENESASRGYPLPFGDYEDTPSSSETGLENPTTLIFEMSPSLEDIKKDFAVRVPPSNEYTNVHVSVEVVSQSARAWNSPAYRAAQYRKGRKAAIRDLVALLRSIQDKEDHLLKEFAFTQIFKKSVSAIDTLGSAENEAAAREVFRIIRDTVTGDMANTYLRDGVCLTVADAVEHLGDHDAIEGRDVRLLSKSVRALGFKLGHARSLLHGDRQS